MSTTDTATAAPPAGWYRDPTGKHQVRWWDGTAWTERVADGPATDEPTEVVEPAEPEAEPEVESEREDPMDRVEGLRPSRVPPAERKSTGAGLGQGASRRGLQITIGVAAIVGLALYWGWHNYESADRWRDRGEALAEQLETTSSNADAVEAALNRAASRGARLQDSQQQLAELREATEMTVDQLRQCATTLNDFLTSQAVGVDQTRFIDRANQVCNTAAYNGEQLIAIVDALDEA
jgi:hypothetical protein